jgi:hypothetical protein
MNSSTSLNQIRSYSALFVAVFFLAFSASSNAENLSMQDLTAMHDTYKANQIRFKRDYAGRQFVGRIQFRTVRESIFGDGEYTVEFGTGGFTSDLDCKVSDPAVLDTIIDWNKGDMITVSGVVKDSMMGSIQLGECSFQ